MVFMLIMAMGQPPCHATQRGDQQASRQSLSQQGFQIWLFFPVDRSSPWLGRQRMQIIRQGFVYHRIEQGPERLILGLIGADPFRVRRIFSQISLDLAPTLRRQGVIYVGVQIVFSDIQRVHRTILQIGPWLASVDDLAQPLPPAGQAGHDGTDGNPQ